MAFFIMLMVYSLILYLTFMLYLTVARMCRRNNLKFMKTIGLLAFVQWDKTVSLDFFLLTVLKLLTILYGLIKLTGNVIAARDKKHLIG